MPLHSHTQTPTLQHIGLNTHCILQPYKAVSMRIWRQKPDKFTGQDSSKPHPFIISCVMDFDSRPHKFATDSQQVSFAASYLSNIAMLWWLPTLVTYPKLSIWGDWGEFVDQLNVYFGQPYLAQASKCALHALKMYTHQLVNKYMIEFSKHATHTGWNDVALYGEFYQGLSEHIKDQL